MFKDDLIVKDNALINASYNLSLAEQRLVLLAISHSRKSGKGISANDYLEIHAEDYISVFGVERHTAYTVLKDASINLFERRFSYQEDIFNSSPRHVLSRWVSTISYIEDQAKLSLIFAPAVIPFISELEKRFTSYQISDISQLTSAYAVRLYELIICWKSAHKTPVFDLGSFRAKLGVDDNQYKLMSDFKRRVLDVAVSQVNTHTNIFVEYEQHKRGRAIIGFSFTFVEKAPDRDPNTVDWIDQGEKKTRKKITKQQAESMAMVGESWSELLARIGKDYHVIGI